MNVKDFQALADRLEMEAWENGYRNALKDILSEIRLGNKDIREFCHEVGQQVVFLKVEAFVRNHGRPPRV